MSEKTSKFVTIRNIGNIEPIVLEKVLFPGETREVTEKQAKNIVEQYPNDIQIIKPEKEKAGPKPKPANTDQPPLVDTE